MYILNNEKNFTTTVTKIFRKEFNNDIKITIRINDTITLEDGTLDSIIHDVLDLYNIPYDKEEVVSHYECSIGTLYEHPIYAINNHNFVVAEIKINEYEFEYEIYSNNDIQFIEEFPYIQYFIVTEGEFSGKFKENVYSRIENHCVKNSLKEVINFIKETIEKETAERLFIIYTIKDQYMNDYSSIDELYNDLIDRLSHIDNFIVHIFYRNEDTVKKTINIYKINY